MHHFSKMLFLLFVTIYSVNSARSQNLVEDATTPLETENRTGVFTETIKIISGSKKIFILTNNNQQLEFGDFVSIALNDKLAARALVAKNHQGNTALKIIKIYSLSQWAKLHRNLEVQIVRGDDSQFEKKPVEIKPEVVVEEETKIKSEEDLFNSKGIIEDDGLDLTDDSKRHIKPDNVVGAMLGYFSDSNVQGDPVRGNVYAASWAYQFTDNYFIEGYYGSTVLKDYPSAAAATNSGRIGTGISKFVVRLKYNIKAPLYSFIMPYVGYESQSASSPGESQDHDTREEEAKKVDELNRSKLAVGVTILRRLVPGWFVKADLGTDVLNLGVAIEF